MTVAFKATPVKARLNENVEVIKEQISDNQLDVDVETGLAAAWARQPPPARRDAAARAA